MSLPSYDISRQIPESFFSDRYDKPSVSPHSFQIRLTIHLMNRCAESGCSFCSILLTQANTSFLSDVIIYRHAITLKRAIIDPEMSLQLCIGLEDFSRTHFFRVPQEWRQTEPARLDQPCDSLTLIQTWISNCESKHSKCIQRRDKTLPGRLLELKPFASSDDIKLVSSLGLDSTTKYAALSHCWGPSTKHPPSTRKSTLDERKQRIKWKELSVTFKDTVRICRDLNLRYLWIDSLCIVQDDKGDWKEQARAMASIYSGAFLTISALASADGTQGCRIQPHDPDRSKLSRFQDFDFGSSRIRMFEHPPNNWHTEFGDDIYRREGYGNNPLRARAWTLQERELSLRSIHLSQGQLLWQCQTMKGCSELPWHEMIRKHNDSIPQPLKLHHEENTDLDDSADQRDRWHGLIEDFSSRYLTKEDDKLPAFAGLATKFYNEQTPGRYLTGIWSNHIPSSLLWRTLSVYRSQDGATNPLAAFYPRRPQRFRAPSWSWVSIDGEITYESQRCQDREQNDISHYDYGQFEIIKLPAHSTKKFDPLESLPNSSLKLRGCLAEVEVGLKSLGSDNLASPWRLVRHDGTTIGAIYPDILDDFRSLQWVTILSVRSEPYNSSIQMPDLLHWADYSVSDQQAWLQFDLRMGLALLPERSSGCYQRVGLVRWVLGDIFDNTAPIEINIV